MCSIHAEGTQKRVRRAGNSSVLPVRLWREEKMGVQFPPGGQSDRAYSTVVVCRIRIAEARVRFSLSPQTYK